MATTTNTSVNLKDVLCADPLSGDIYKHLFQGGSWFEADQMHWRLQQQMALKGLTEVVKTKPTKINKEKAALHLSDLRETVTQLLPQNDSLAVFKQADRVVQAWAPPPPKISETLKKNVFAMLAEEF